MQSPQHAADALNVIPCPPEQRREALLQLAAAHDPAQQTALGAAINAMTDQPNAQWDGLLIGRAGTRLVGAIWVQALPPEHGAAVAARRSGRTSQRAHRGGARLGHGSATPLPCRDIP
ncbi:hypothetical protein LPL18_000040 [Halomonas sp. CUBES01]|uniref:hypothetical protein n=1 Tax=Halomonas sp. CUBES01 TaxID=2897340 RepID=UPI002DDD6074|nr:hypothetical protein [Halomonas sp. CUBES01]MEC4765740.1 hypothetical protein [Halomonas sp. CUBES01]